MWWRPALEKFEGANTVWFKDGTSAEVTSAVFCLFVCLNPRQDGYKM